MPLDVTLTGAELAATGVADFASRLMLAVLLIAFGAVLLYCSRRLRTR